MHTIQNNNSGTINPKCKDYIVHKENAQKHEKCCDSPGRGLAIATTIVGLRRFFMRFLLIGLVGGGPLKVTIF